MTPFEVQILLAGLVITLVILLIWLIDMSGKVRQLEQHVLFLDHDNTNMQKQVDELASDVARCTSLFGIDQ